MGRNAYGNIYYSVQNLLSHLLFDIVKIRKYETTLVSVEGKVLRKMFAR